MAFGDGWVWVMGLEIGDGAEMGEFGDEWVRRWSLAGICGFGFGRDRWIWVWRLKRWSLGEEMVSGEDGYRVFFFFPGMGKRKNYEGVV